MPNGLRILSGTVRANSDANALASGSFIINFYPLSLDVGTPGYELRNAKEIGPQGPFNSLPATIVAPAQFAIGEGGDYFVAYVNVNDSLTLHTLTVDWAIVRGSGSAPVFMQDIRFMIIGEVSGMPPGAGGLPPLPPVILERKRTPRKPVPRKAAKKGRR
jgi:hypothetical protein